MFDFTQNQAGSSNNITNRHRSTNGTSKPAIIMAFTGGKQWCLSETDLFTSFYIISLLLLSMVHLLFTIFVKFLQFVGIVSTSPSPNIEHVCCPCLCIGYDLFADLCQKMRIGKAGDEPPQWPLGGQRSWVSANPSPSKTKTTPIKYGSNDVEIPY